MPMRQQIKSYFILLSVVYLIIVEAAKIDSFGEKNETKVETVGIILPEKAIDNNSVFIEEENILWPEIAVDKSSAFIEEEDVENTNETMQDELIRIVIDTTVTKLPLPLPPGIILMFMTTEQTFHVNYSLSCFSPHERFILRATLQRLTHPRVAYLTESVRVNISCEDENAQKGIDDLTDLNTTHMDNRYGNSSFIVIGDFNVTISARLLGKGLLVFSLIPIQSTTSLDSSHADIRSSRLTSTSSSNISSSSSLTSSSLDSTDVLIVHRTPVIILRLPRTIDKVFRIIIYIIIILANISMGCKTDMKIVIEVLKKPLAPIIGFCCQYICMPLIAYGIARLATLDNSAAALGIFACGICPGGGISNMYTYLLGGDLQLSIALTTISTIASLGMIPLWLFTLGSTLDTGEIKVKIPYLNVLESLAMVILPLFFGMLLQYKCQKIAKIIIKMMKPLFLIAILFVLSVGIYANLYIFLLFEPKVVLAGCLLPYIGYVVGGFIPLVLRMPWSRVKTIAIETGIQNIGLALVMLIFSIPPPDGELAAIGPIASGTMTPLPLIVITVLYTIYNKVKHQQSFKERDQAAKAAILKDAFEKEIVCGGWKEKNILIKSAYSEVGLDTKNDDVDTKLLSNGDNKNFLTL